jgi:hypothetical protein
VIVGAMGAAIAARTRQSKGDCWSNGCGNRSKNQAVKGSLLDRWARQSRQEPGCQRVIVGSMGAAIAAIAARTRPSKGDCWSNGCGNPSNNQAVKE